MNLLELFIIAVGLSMDAFAVAACAGVTMRRAGVKKSVTVGLYFGIFQGTMPLIGFFLATWFADKIVAFDHWIAFALLSVIGGKMIFESFKKEEATTGEFSVLPSKMLPLAVATSIDALAVGVSFAFLQIEDDIVLAVLFIGITTFILSVTGVKIGNIFGMKFKSKAEFAGGLILILMGTKILFEHMGIINVIWEWVSSANK